MMANFKKYYFTKESFEKVELDIDKAEMLMHLIHPLIKLFEKDGISISFIEMQKMLTGKLRQTWLSKSEDINHLLFIERQRINGNMYYIVNKNFDWDWYEKQCEEEIINSKNSVIGENITELDLLRSIVRMINKEFKGEYGIYKETLPDNIVMAIKIWNEKFNK